MRILPVRTLAIAMLGELGPMTEQIRKVLHALGHPPLLFHSLNELQAFGARAEELAMLFLIAPTDFGNCLLSCRQLVGASVPIVALANALDEISELATRQCLFTEITVASTRLADTFGVLQCAMNRHQFAVGIPIMQCGDILFYPASNMIGTALKHFMLTPAMFDVLFELAFAQEVLQTPAWFASIAQRHGVSPSELRAEIPKIRQRVGLVPSKGWRLVANVRSGYWLGAMSANDKQQVTPTVAVKVAPVVKRIDPSELNDSDLEFAAFMRGTMPPSIEYFSLENILQSQLIATNENSL